MEAEIGSLHEKNNSYLSEIEIYEERERYNSRNKNITPNEWEELTETIEKLSQEKEELLDKLELQQLKEDNVSMPLKAFEVKACESVIKMAHQQLEEI